MAYKVYEYGGSPWVAIDEATAIEQISGRHKLWNQLVELDHAYRARVRETLRDDEQDKLDALKATIDTLREQIRARRRAQRKRSVDLGTLKDELTAARLEYKELVFAAKARKPAIVAAQKEALAQLRQEHWRAIKEAQHGHGLYWCNYDDVRMCYEIASKRAAKTGAELRFRRWDGSGKVAVRYQHGLPVAEAFAGTDTRFRIDPVPEAVYSRETSRRRRRKLCLTKCRIRVGSDDRKKPIWLEVPISYYHAHGPLPPEAKILTVFAVRELLPAGPGLPHWAARETLRPNGRGWPQVRRWRVCICIDDGIPDGQKPARTGPRVAIDLGWRKVEGGLRVAYWADETGAHGEWVLPAKVLGEHRKLADLRSIQDGHLEVAKAAIARWLATQEKPPEWMGEVSHLKDWRSRTRMERLALSAPPDVDPELRRIFDTWLERHWHLAPWEANLRDQAIRRRREIYRIWVGKLTKTHSTIVLEKFDLRGVAERGDETAARTKPVASDQRVVAAVSVLRQAIRLAGQTVEVDAAYSTQRCSWCGNEEPWDAAASLLHRCSNVDCPSIRMFPGGLWDQDHNAARNLLAISQIGGEAEPKTNLPETGPVQGEEVLSQQRFAERLQSPAQGAGD